MNIIICYDKGWFIIANISIFIKDFYEIRNNLSINGNKYRILFFIKSYATFKQSITIAIPIEAPPKYNPVTNPTL